MVDDLVANDNAANNLCLDTSTAEAILSVLLCESGFSNEYGFIAWKAIDSNVVGVLADKAPEVTIVVGYELTLSEGFGIKWLGHWAFLEW